MQAKPDKILELTDAFMASKQLYAAERVGLFEALADGPEPIQALANELEIPVDRLRITADAMVAVELLEREGELYKNSAEADAFLSGQGPADLRPALRYRDQVSYDMWADFPEAIETGDVDPVEFEEEEVALFSDAMAAFTGGMVQKLARIYDWSRHERLLDIGGGKGQWLAILLRENPELEGTLFELPDVAEIARDEIPEALKDRIDVVAGDALADPLPEGHDAVLVANVIHQFTSETNEQLMGRIRKRVEPGARLLLADTWTDPSGAEPVSAALLSGEFLVFNGQGRGYRTDEARTWLENTGWTVLDHRPVEGPESVVIAEAQ